MPQLLGSDPYPWPYDGVLDGSRCALVVAGAQPAWARMSCRVGEVLAVIGAVAGALRGVGGHVVAVQHSAPQAGRPRRLPPPVDDAAAGLLVDLPALDLIVGARGTNGFHASPLDVELRALGVDRLIMCGFGAEATVDSTLRSANDRGYECLTLIDGTAPFDEDTGRRALASITMSGGIFGAIATSTALLAAVSESQPAPVAVTA